MLDVLTVRLISLSKPVDPIMSKNCPNGQGTKLQSLIQLKALYQLSNNNKSSLAYAGLGLGPINCPST